jgi:hypothetical protein
MWFRQRKASKSTELMSIYTEQQDEVAKFLITCLQDVKAQIVNVVREQTDEDEEPQVSEAHSPVSQSVSRSVRPVTSLAQVPPVTWMTRHGGV